MFARAGGLFPRGIINAAIIVSNAGWFHHTSLMLTEQAGAGSPSLDQHQLASSFKVKAPVQRSDQELSCSHPAVVK